MRIAIGAGTLSFRIGRVAMPGALLLLLLLTAAPAAWSAPAALVTDVSGEVTPEVGAFDEVDAGTVLSLGARSTLTIEHYASCEAAKVNAGAVGVRADGLDLSRASVADRWKIDCPEAVSLHQGELVGAGIVLRSADRPPRIPLAPEIVVAGGGAGFDRLRVEREGQLVWALPVRGGRVDWPKGRRFLTDQGAYLLVLDGPAGEHYARVVADSAAAGRTVLRP
jgi:hypothetical protein